MGDLPSYTFPDETSPQGNIFFIIAEVEKLLNTYGLGDEANEMKRRILEKHEAKSYEEAKSIIGEYVNVY